MRLLYIISFFILCSCSHFTGKRTPSSLESSAAKIGVVGDLEGNFEQLRDFINQGDTLYYQDGKVQLRDGAHFIFLGDATDRGPGSIRILDTLNDLKKRYPDRITLIAGNREINKLRILTYIFEARNRPVPPIVIPWYKKIVKEELGNDVDHLSDKEFQNFVRPFDSDIFRLKAFLAGMNAKDAFNFRKEELRLLAPMLEVSDEDVFNSFMDDFSENGRMRIFLENASAGILKDGNLFVHGAITSENFGHVPSLKNRIFNTGEWITNLNQWFHKEIIAWFNDDIHRKKLFDYHAPAHGKTTNPKSVIYGRFSENSGNPKAPSNNLLKMLKKDGVHRIVVGHTPTGDYPIIMRKGEFEVLLADSSYSTLKGAPRIIIDSDKLLVESTMPDGKILRIETSAFDKTNPLGVITRDGARVIGAIDDSDDLLVMKVAQKEKSFSTSYEKIHVDDFIENKDFIKKNCFQLLSIINRFRSSISSDI